MGSGFEKVLVILEGSDKLKKMLLKNAFSDEETFELINNYYSKIIKIDQKKVHVNILSDISIIPLEILKSANENLALVFLCSNEDDNAINIIEKNRHVTKEFKNSVEAILYFNGEDKKNENDLIQFAETNQISFHNVTNSNPIDVALTIILKNCLNKANEGKRCCCGS